MSVAGPPAPPVDEEASAEPPPSAEPSPPLIPQAAEPTVAAQPMAATPDEPAVLPDTTVRQESPAPTSFGPADPGTPER